MKKVEYSQVVRRKLKALKIHTILLTWDVDGNRTTSTAKLLRDEACTHIELGKLITENAQLLAEICERK